MKTTRLNLAACAIVIGVAGSGCSQGTVDIGNQQAAQTKTGLAAFAASWDGYIEAYKFTDNSDRVRVTVNNDGTGTLRFGDKELLALANNPNANYPTNYPNAGGVIGGPALPSDWAGFSYALVDLRVETARLRASAASKEIFASWCNIQTPHTIDTDVYTCMACDFVSGVDTSIQDAGVDSGTCSTYDPCPSASINATFDAWNSNPVGPRPPEPIKVPAMCEQQALCVTGNYVSGVRTGTNPNPTCICDANSCRMGTLAQDIQLDAALENNQQTMTGTLALGGTNYTVRLIRQ